MASAFGEILEDFDLDFLSQTSSQACSVPYDVKLQKQRKSLQTVKKKTVMTDMLIKKFYEKKEALEQAEKSLVESKLECKQICIDYRKAVERVAVLEQSEQTLQSINKGLQEQVDSSDSRIAAIQVHANQLQLLIKKNEEEIEAENEKYKEASKKCAIVEKEKKAMLSHIRMMKEIIFGRRTLDKQMKSILRNYISSDEDSELVEDIIHNEAALWLNNNGDCGDEIITTCKESGDESTGYDDMTYKSGKNEICDIERNEYCAEITSSVDTGCGSSIAMSGSEKCLSPEYNSSNDSPLSIELPTKVIREKIDAATSPILYEVCDVATSPIHFSNSDNFVRPGTTPKCKKPKHYVDSTTSPIPEIVDKEYCNIPKILITNFNNIPLTCIEENDVVPVKDIEKEKECLEINNSLKVCDNRNNDPEVSDILKTMSLHYSLITPLPPSPTTISVASQTEKAQGCSEGARALEGLKQVQFDMANMAKGLSEIKSFLINGDKKSPEAITTVHDVIENIDEHESDNYAALDDSCQDATQILEANSGISEVDMKKKRISKRLSFHDPLPKNIVMSDVENTDDNHQIRSKEKCCDINSKLDDLTNNNSETRPKRKVKMTRLQKFKSKLLPKSKISSSVSKTRLRSRKTLQTPSREKVILSVNDSSKTLNDEAVYLKAVAVAAAMRAKTKHEKERVLKRKGSNIGTLDENRVPQKVIQTHSEIKNVAVKSSANTTDVTRLDNSYKKIGLQEKVNEMIDKQITPFNPESPKISKKLVSPTKVQRISEETPFNPASPKISKKLVTPTKVQRISVDNSSHNVVRTRSMSKNNKEPIITNKTMNNEKKNCKKMMEEHSFKNDGNNSNGMVSPSEPDKIPRKRKSSTQKSPIVESKRKLRSSSIRLSESRETDPNNDNDISKRSPIVLARKLDMNAIEIELKAENCRILKGWPSQEKVLADYGDLDLFTNSSENVPQDESTMVQNKNAKGRNNRNKFTAENQTPVSTPKDSVLCRMIQKYGKSSTGKSKKISEKRITEVFNKIDGSMRNIMALPPNETKKAMNRLINDLKELEFKPFMAGLMKYLKEPDRKAELLGKVFAPAAPPMSKSEHILLYVISQLKSHWRSVDLVEELLRNMEYALFKLNCTPDFEVIESMSHLYAVLCRYSRNKNRLRLFMLDAMYCISYKSIALIRQCIEVWMHVLPLAHLGIAKSPMIVCLVYLLHFYKCEDRHNRVKDMRQILQRKYSYEFSEWNEKKILEMLKNWILDVKSLPVENKMLRLTLIIMAKRQGARWCEKNIIKNLLLPLIEDQSTAEPVKVFCISTLGPLLRPFPNDMKVHCEVVFNQLLDMLDQNLSPVVEEAVYTSLVYMNRHNQLRVNEALLKWKPQRELPKDLDNLLRNYVREKPIRVWKTQLSKLWLKNY